tara:strand:- start:2520 stop:2750 length:231 start_codon:yes stop_codon:yes gene_type:complete
MNIYIFSQSSSFFYIGMSIAKLRRRKKNRLSLREGKGKIKKEEGENHLFSRKGTKSQDVQLQTPRLYCTRTLAPLA